MSNNKSIVFLRKKNISDYLRKEFDFHKFTLQEFANLIAIQHNSLLILKTIKEGTILLGKDIPQELIAAEKVIYNGRLGYIAVSQDVHPNSSRELAKLLASSSESTNEEDIDEIEEWLKQELELLADTPIGKKIGKKKWN